MKNTEPIGQESHNDVYFNFFRKIISHWHYFLISVTIALIIAFFVIKSSDEKFSNNLVLLIQESSQRRANMRSDLDQLQMFSLQSAIEDELGIIKSYPVVSQAVKELNLEVSYFIKNGFIKPEIYKNSPFDVMFSRDVPQPVDLEFELSRITKDGYMLKALSEKKVDLYLYRSDSVVATLDNLKVSKQYNFGDEVEIGSSKFKIILNANFNEDFLKGKTLYFKFNNIEGLTYNYLENLSVTRISNQSYLVNVKFSGNNPELVSDFLNTLAKEYLNKNLEKKNNIAHKTIDFIDRQISGIADSLGLTADQLKDFRVKNSVMDIDFLSRTVYEQMTVLENRRAELLVASKYYDYIKEYFENNKNLTDLLAPSAMGVDDPQLQSLIEQLTDKNAKRQLQLDNKSPNNPTLPILNAEINNLKKTIIENIDYIVYTSNITINDINQRIAQLKGQVRNLPSIEKELKNIEREFHVNDAIYTFLLTTRAEAEIARASNSPDYEVVDPARVHVSIKVAPKKTMIMAISLLLGLLFPASILILKSSFNSTVEDKKELEKYSNLPYIGSIPHNENKSQLPLYDFPKSIIAESFRSIRTSMQFFQKGSPKQKILVTSPMSGDGKSFISMNLAAAYSSFGKRTILLEFDLRKPKLTEYLGLPKTKSLSSYLINDARLEDIIQKTGMKNFDIICAGELPPNPVELIASEKTKNLIDILQSIYDFIIIDTPPLGVVTDSFLLMEHSDVNLFVVRLNHTDKKFLGSLMKDVQLKEIPNLAFIINDDLEKSKSSYYENDDTQNSIIKKRFRIFSSLFKK